jgi:hypothetical protein
MKGNHLSNTGRVTALALSDFIKHESLNSILTKCVQYFIAVLLIMDKLTLDDIQHEKCHTENNFDQAFKPVIVY